MYNQNRLTLTRYKLKLLQEQNDQPFTQLPARSKPILFHRYSVSPTLFSIQLKISGHAKKQENVTPGQENEENTETLR